MAYRRVEDRADHPIAEDAFPGAVVLDEPALSAILGTGWLPVRGSFDPYVDVDFPDGHLARPGDREK